MTKRTTIIKRAVRKMRAADAAAVSAMFGMVCDEMAGVVPPALIASYRQRHDPAHLKAMLRDPHALMLVSEEGGPPSSPERERRRAGVITGLLFGGSAAGIGTIHWLRTHPAYRDRGYGHALYFAAAKEFARRGCFKILIFLFPDAREIVRFFEHEGFTAGELISEDYFGIPLRPMVKLIRAPRPDEATRRLVLLGSAGQGIKVMSHALAAILASLGKHVALTVTYPTTVRAGTVRADLTYADAPVDTPFIEKADLLLQLTPVKKTDMVEAVKTIRDRGVARLLSDEYRAEERDVEEISFKEIAVEQFGSPIFVNMVALGKLLRYLGVDIEKVEFRDSLPAKFLEQNIRAIKYGYASKDE